MTAMSDASATFDPRRDALLVVDLQPDFMPGGPLAVAGGDEIAAPIGVLARRFTTVIATQDFHPRDHVSFASTHGRKAFDVIELHGAPQTLWPNHCVQGTPGAKLHAALPDDAISLVLRKGTRREVDSYSAFRENLGPDGARASTGLEGLLKARGVEALWVCGLARDVCVAWSAIDAAHAGFRVTLVDSLTRAVDASPEARDRTDARLREAGVVIASEV
jgi:nicotinamidase/pyrazinamidase